MYGQAKHKVSKLVHTAKSKFYTERISLASFSKELHQIVNTLSNRHPPKILPNICPSADLPSIFIKHFTNKVEKLRANIASEHVTSTLVTGTTAATFSSLEKVSQLTVKECILNSAPKSCEQRNIYLCGDFNINLFNYDSNNQVNYFSDSIYSLGLFPLITKPTRITSHSATLIDNIFTNIHDYVHMSGIIVCDISDHFPVFTCKKVITHTCKQI